MNRNIIIAAVIVAIVTISGVQGEEQATAAEVKAQTTCPVLGGAINKKLYADVDGKRIYVCCKGCISKVAKDPATYIKKLEDEGVTIAKLQTTCPVMGGKINRGLHVDANGKRIYVCCQGCVGAVKSDPNKYIKKLETDGVVVEDTPAEIHGNGHHH
jgi:YHS domain-containing protein